MDVTEKISPFCMWPIRVARNTYLDDGLPGGERQDVGTRHLVAALRVAVDGGLGAQDRLEPLPLQRLVVAVPPLVVAVRVHDHDRRIAAL